MGLSSVAVPVSLRRRQSRNLTWNPKYCLHLLLLLQLEKGACMLPVIICDVGNRLRFISRASASKCGRSCKLYPFHKQYLSVFENHGWSEKNLTVNDIIIWRNVFFSGPAGKSGFELHKVSDDGIHFSNIYCQEQSLSNLIVRWWFQIYWNSNTKRSLAPLGCYSSVYINIALMCIAWTCSSFGIFPHRAKPVVFYWRSIIIPPPNAFYIAALKKGIHDT